MITVDNKLGNFFADKNISRQHLLAYAKDHLQRLIIANTNHQYDTLIAFLTSLITALSSDLNSEDTSKNVRKGKTISVDQVTADFGKGMSDREKEIARKLGGVYSEGFIEFYPNGLTEYSNPNRENTALFVTRVNKAATKYAEALGDELTVFLQGFEHDFETARTSQTIAKASVSAAKSDIVDHRYNLEIGLNKSLHEIGVLFPGDAASCNHLFNFNLLYPVTHHTHDVHNGTIIPGGMGLVINRTMTDTVTIEVKNTGTNASILIWLGATDTDVDNAMSVEVMPGRTATIKPSDIGDLTKTFLLIKNNSSVNNAAYTVTIIG